MTRVGDWTNANQERQPLPTQPEPPKRSRAAVIRRLTYLLQQVADELDDVPEDQREPVLSEAVLRANGAE